MVSMKVSLKAAVTKTTNTLQEYIQKQLLAGVSQDVIRENLSKDLEAGGRIFGEFRNAVKATTQGTIGKQATDAYLSEFGTEISYTWIAALVNTCEDCLGRHGEVNSYPEWESQGLPRSGWSVCRENCQCVLIPEEMAKERTELTKPLDRSGARDRAAENAKRYNPTGV